MTKLSETRETPFSRRRPIGPVARQLASGALLLWVSGCGSSATEPAPASAGTLGTRGALEFTVEPTAPPAEGPNSFVVRLHEVASDQPFAGAILSVMAHMPSMGHEMPAGARIAIDETEPGVYAVSEVVFSMPGVWEVLFEAERADVVDEASFHYEVP